MPYPFNELPLAEPLIITCNYITGGRLWIDEGSILQFIGWITIPMMAGESDEKRIVTRLAMPIGVAKDLVADFKAMLNLQ
jgi:hypothetical protein